PVAPSPVARVTMPKPVVPKARLGMARGPRRIAALIAVGMGFVLGFFGSTSALGVFLAWGGLAALLVNAGALLRWLPTLIVAIILLVPGAMVRNALEARRVQQRTNAQ